MIVTQARASGILFDFASEVGGRWLVPANICPVVPLALRLAGVEVVFVDIDPVTLCLDVAQAERILAAGADSPASGFAGVLYARAYGSTRSASADFARLRAVAPSLRLVDDRCLCLPDPSAIDSQADLTLFSTGYAKQVELGHGGIGVARGDIVHRPLEYTGVDIEKLYKDHMVRGTRFAAVPAGWLDNSPLCDSVGYQAAVERAMPGVRRHKERMNAIYRTSLPAEIQLPDELQGWRFNIWADDKERLLQAIFADGLFVSSHYAPVNKLFDNDVFPVAERVSRRIVNLFNDFHFTEPQARRLCDIVNRHLDSRPA